VGLRECSERGELSPEDVVERASSNMADGIFWASGRALELPIPVVAGASECESRKARAHVARVVVPSLGRGRESEEVGRVVVRSERNASWGEV
jgi:hypothetical protein